MTSAILFRRAALTRTSRSGRHRSLVHWFSDSAMPRNAYAVVGLTAMGYSVGVALQLAIAHALPMPDPYLRKTVVASIQAPTMTGA